MKFPSRYQITDDGILIQDYKDPTDKTLLDRYSKQDYMNSILSDLQYYRGLFSSTVLREELLKNEYDICYSFGGGTLKFESFLRVKEFIIYDAFSFFVQEFIEFFKTRSNLQANVSFIETFITSELISSIKLDRNLKTIFTFIHFIEHQSFDEHINMLKLLPKGIDVIIYGPNVENASSEDWIHFRPADHNTFIPLLKFKEILQSFNYEIKIASNYGDDLLIYFNTGNDHERI